MSEIEHLLPANATPLEQTFAASAARVQRIPVPIDTVKRPLDTPAAFLPFVGWEYSVDVWFRTWPEATKRAVTSRSLILHRHKGTAYAIREYIRYAGGSLDGIVAPPQGVFSGPSLTAEQREAWLSGLPQVRTWLIQERATAPRRKLFSGGHHRGVFYALRPVTTPSTALSRLRRRARWVVAGAETDITVTETGDWFRLHLRAALGRRVVAAAGPGRRFFVPSDAWRRLLTIRPVETLPWRVAVGPSLQAVQSKADRVAVRAAAGRRVIGYHAPRRRFFVPTTAPMRLFDRYAVFDGTGPVRPRAVTFMGRGRYGFPSHTAELRVAVQAHRHRRAAGNGIVARRTRFWMPHDPEPLERIRRAIVSAKRLSDRLLLDIGPRPRFVAGKPFIADVDSFVVGLP